MALVFFAHLALRNSFQSFKAEVGFSLATKANISLILSSVKSMPALLKLSCALLIFNSRPKPVLTIAMHPFVSFTWNNTAHVSSVKILLNSFAERILPACLASVANTLAKISGLSLPNP